MMKVPKGFKFAARNAGIKDSSLDFGVVFCEKKCEATALFTKNNFVGAPIIVGKEHIKNGKLQAICVNSKNANVFNLLSKKGINDCLSICKRVASEFSLNIMDVLPSSTGVIGVPLPVEKILNACDNLKSDLHENNWLSFAKSIMTTDTKPKYIFKSFETSNGEASILAIAKGSGMIEPNMATMLCYIFTDAIIERNLYQLLKDSCDKSFNCISVDSDTSTSDTVVLMSSGMSGSVCSIKFQQILDEVCVDLAKQIVRDGEGVSKLIELHIYEAKTKEQAKKIGKSIINSPLVKTAIYGSDPNWGRVIMAIGKVFDEFVHPSKLKIFFGEYPAIQNSNLNLIANYIKKNSTIELSIFLGNGDVHCTFWGCDLTEKYIEENAYYTS